MNKSLIMWGIGIFSLEILLAAFWLTKEYLNFDLSFQTFQFGILAFMFITLNIFAAIFIIKGVNS